jgi:phage major head subunit gpT-like protein
MARFKMVNSERIQLTAEEEAQLDADQAVWEAGKFDRAMANLRADRNRRLAITDWHGLSDVSMSAAMRQYRQELRDFPSNKTTVEQINSAVWPTEPSS